MTESFPSLVCIKRLLANEIICILGSYLPIHPENPGHPLTPSNAYVATRRICPTNLNPLEGSLLFFLPGRSWVVAQDDNQKHTPQQTERERLPAKIHVTGVGLCRGNRTVELRNRTAVFWRGVQRNLALRFSFAPKACRNMTIRTNYVRIFTNGTASPH